MSHWLGITAALSAAFVWTWSSFLYRRTGRTIPPMVMNLYKGLLGLALFLITLVGMGQWDLLGSWHPAIPALLISGAIGIGFGDTAYFIALNRIGEQRSLLISQTLAPIFAAVIAAVWLSEILNETGYLGIAMTLVGIGVVIFERTEDHAARRDLRFGAVFAALAAAGQAIGIVITRDVFLEEDLPTLADASIFAIWTAAWRIAAGAAVLLPMIPLYNRLLPHRRQPILTAGFRSPHIWWPLLLAILLGSYLGIFFQQFALHSTSAALAQTLFAFSSIWALGFERWFGPKKPKPGAYVGAALAVAGIAVVLMTNGNS